MRAQPGLFQLLVCMIVTSFTAQALPVGFGRNQADLQYRLLKGPRFLVYYDEDAPTEARFVARSLEGAKPILDRWLDVSRTSPLPVIMSATTSNASFANPITDVIELQSLGLVSRDDVWHEFVHSTMYLQFSNFLGPIGSLLHLIWMPAWAIEGLAEALSVSIGSDLQAGIERYHALSGEWPSFATLHNLYGKQGAEFHLGYGTSGAFMSWILKKNPRALVPLLTDFYRFSMPWYYPLSVNPLSSFLPFDEALRKHFGKPSFELYEDYKKEATQFWESQYTGPFLSRSFPHWKDPNPRVQHEVVPFEGRLLRIWKTEHATLWFDHKGERLRFCVKGLQVCPLESKTPSSLNYLGEETNEKGVRNIVFAKVDQSLEGASYDIFFWNVEEGTLEKKRGTIPGTPISYAFVENKHHLLMGHHSRRIIHEITSDGVCAQDLILEDTPFFMSSHSNESFLLNVYQGAQQSTLKVKPQELTSRPCQNWGEHQSPLLVAVQVASKKNQDPDLSLALTLADTWQSDRHRSNSTQGDPSASLGMTEKKHPESNNRHPERSRGISLQEDLYEDTSETWHPRPVFALPWIGGDDPLGYQFGIISVPLMDHMQNETLRCHLFYGAESKFPDSECVLSSTRFHPTLETSAFRRQLWLGNFYSKLQHRYRSSYADEKGVRFSSRWNFDSNGSEKTVDVTLLISQREKYQGPWPIIEGTLVEPQVRLSWSKPLAANLSVFANASGRLAPKGVNDNFSYNALSGGIGAATNLFAQSTLLTGIEAGRTRGEGKKTPLLREFYQPLKTFIPGGGGGYNKIHLPISGQGSLFSLRYGDTRSRAYANWTIPIIPHVDRLFWILYVDRLDFTTFYNYGGVWHQREKLFAHNLQAHGYTLDLQMENKGVRFNLGLGAGQVLGEGVQTYGTFGFDAIF